MTTEITVTSLEEFINALNAGKTAITVKADTIDFTEAPAEATAFSQGILTLETSLTIEGAKTLGKDPVIQGGFKLNTGVGSFIAQNLVFDGKNQTIGTLCDVGGALETSKIIIRGCEIMQYAKSLFYGNIVGSSVGSASFSRLLVHDMGKGQGVFDIRKTCLGSVVIENSTFYNDCRDIIRADDGFAESICIRNNTFSNVSNTTNGLLYVRSDIGDSYVVENNLFLNETGTSTILANTTAKTPVMKKNYFFNCTSSAFWTGVIDQATATANGGGVLDNDPCEDSAGAQFKLTNQTLKDLGVGDPRWR